MLDDVLIAESGDSQTLLPSSVSALVGSRNNLLQVFGVALHTALIPKYAA
jgi:hypothetical protein